MSSDLVLERVNAGNCPICKKKLEEPITFMEYKGSRQPVHTRHIQFEQKGGVHGNHTEAS